MSPILRTKPNSRFQSGQSVLLVVFLSLIIILAILTGVAAAIASELRISKNLERSHESYILAESLLEEVVYRLRKGMDVDVVEAISVSGYTTWATTTTFMDGKRVKSSADVDRTFRNVQANLLVGSGAAFNFGVQTGEGGLRMQNTSSVAGNVFSNGEIRGYNSNIIEGEAISAGPVGLISGVHATGSVYAHNIENNLVEWDAYYQVDLGDNEIWGDTYPGTEDQDYAAFPITDEHIESLKQDAALGGVITEPCPYIIDSEETIGPVKVECDLIIQQSSAIVTLAGNIWVEGDFITEVGQPTVKIDSSLGPESVAIIADNPLNRTTSSKIIIRNAPTFENSGTEGSYILLISQNNSSETGGTEVAVDVEQSAIGDFLIYAAHGEVSISQSGELREVTGYRITLWNSARVIYESGIASLLFTSGPGGGYTIDSWREIE